MSSSRKFAGRLFQTRATATAKLLSPNVLCVRGTAHDLSLDERSRRRGPSETKCMSSARYEGAWPDNDEKTKHASYMASNDSNSVSKSTGVKVSVLVSAILSAQSIGIVALLAIHFASIVKKPAADPSVQWHGPCACVCLRTADPPMYAESLTGAVDIRDEDDDQPGSVGDYMFTPMYTYVYDYRYRCPPAYSEV